jgi:hypothetical protein
MSYFEYIRRRIRHSGFIRLLLEVLAKVGINLRPFVVMREGVSYNMNTPRIPDPDFEAIEIRYLEAADMPALASLSDLPGRSITESELQKRLRAGNKCAALTVDGALAAFTWCDFEACSFRGYPFRLKANEVYLFDAYTLVAFRGKGLAPYIRYSLYVDLARQGRDYCYSISDRFNRPSLRFKEKLKAQWLVSGVYLVLFSRWRFTFMLKHHQSDVPLRDGPLQD